MARRPRLPIAPRAAPPAPVVEAPAGLGNRAIREVNRALVLELLRREGPLSRSDLARRSALTKPTVSAIVEPLLAAGVLQEVGQRTSAVGRRATLLAVDPSSATYLGIHFGETTTAVALADARGELTARRQIPAVRGDVAAALSRVVALVEALLLETGTDRERVERVGVSVPGLVEPRSGICVLAPNLRWREVPLADALGERLGAPALVVNTTQAAALAEGRRGAAVGAGSFVWIYVGRGIGAGIVIDGALELGTSGFTGELGHCAVASDGPRCGCGRRGCLETFASDRAIERRAAALAREVGERGAAGRTAAGVLAAARAGSPSARRALAEAGAHLGRGVSYLVNLLDPARIVVGGDVLPYSEDAMTALRRVAGERSVRPTPLAIVPTALGDDAYVAGAVLLAFEHATRAIRVVRVAD